LAALAILGGFALGQLKQWLSALSAVALPTYRWRVLEAGNIWLQVPTSWGDVEPNPSGGLVIHNRPRRFRIDGDAVWYASAIELHIRAPEAETLRSAEGMTTYRRTIGNANAPALLVLAVANGVGPKQQRIAQRVLNSARLKQRE
jgi:hypothetical protein